MATTLNESNLLTSFWEQISLENLKKIEKKTSKYEWKASDNKRISPVSNHSTEYAFAITINNENYHGSFNVESSSFTMNQTPYDQLGFLNEIFSRLPLSKKMQLATLVSEPFASENIDALIAPFIEKLLTFEAEPLSIDWPLVHQMLFFWKQAEFVSMTQESTEKIEHTWNRKYNTPAAPEPVHTIITHFSFLWNNELIQASLIRKPFLQKNKTVLLPCEVLLENREIEVSDFLKYLLSLSYPERNDFHFLNDLTNPNQNELVSYLLPLQIRLNAL